MSQNPFILALSATFAVLTTASVLPAQQPAPGSLEPPTAPVAVLTTALYNDQANVRGASDSAQAGVATEVIRAHLTEKLGAQLVPNSLVDSLALSSLALGLAGGAPCHVKVVCAVAVAQEAGARWVVMTKVSKTSSLIWLLSAQLIRVGTGEIVLDDSTELKGDPGTMIRLGARSFADRVARTIQAGGRTTNFPNGEPEYP
jgi:hypothetical protein